jgi:hypothetical protein
MSINLLRNNDLGSYKDIKYVIDELLVSQRPKKIADIREYCISNSVDLAYSFNGIIDLFEFLSLVSIENSVIILDTKSIDIREHTATKAKLCDVLIRSIFFKLKEHDLLHAFLNLENIKYDIPFSTISIHKNSIPLGFSGLRNLLIELGFFHLQKKIPYLLLVAPQYLDLFENQILLWIRMESGLDELPNIGLSFDDLTRIQRLREHLGDEAEEYVLEYEVDRLSEHPQKDKIKKISKIDVTAGYDIISFNSPVSNFIDRYIEVKSFSKDIGFYWSKNEVKAAVLKGNIYFLYLVDRDSMNRKDYEPLIIHDPFTKVFMNESWHKDEQNWFVTPTKKVSKKQ